MSRRAAALALACVACSAHPSAALADGDPGSDVLVNQSLFFEPDSNISIAQQEKLQGLLQGSTRAGVPIRVAIIATPQDLGAVTELWREPRAYARFLGIELSLTYSGRLLIVMPNGIGFYWQGHPTANAYRALGGVLIRPGAAGLTDATETAVHSLASAAGITLRSTSTTSQRPQQTASSAPQAAAPPGTSGSGSSVDELVAAIFAAAVIGAAVLFLVRRWRLRTTRRAPRARSHPGAPRVRTGVAVAGAVTVAAGAAIAALLVIGPPQAAQSQSDALATNPYLDPGTPLSRPAPDFTLTDQDGQTVSLRSFRGRVVLLAFNDSECTTICPLTTTAMLDAKAMLGPAGADIQLLGVDANPKATSLEDVYSYSQLHGMLSAWHFLTGPLPALQHVWNAYDIEAAVQGGEIAHTPALFVIDPEGRERKLYMTQQSYAAIGQLGQLLAREASGLLPGHPAVDSRLSYSQIGGISPATPKTLPRSGGGGVRIGPGRPRLYMFFATWDRQITGLAAGLEGLGRYSALARRLGLPPLTAIDEGSVEPPGALRAFLATLDHPLPYPVAIDRAGRVADGYEVEGLPWLMVVSGHGKIAWYYSVAALGWPSTGYLIARVREALIYAAGPPRSLSAALAGLAGSPAPLASLHSQAGRLLGGEPALADRIRALRGYPIVINAWASWCTPCRSEFGLFASASARYGRQVAFLGADSSDSAGDARTFLQQHPVSYPSYQTTIPEMTAIVPQGLGGLPTTIFVGRTGKLVWVHTGQYVSQGILDADIQAYALGG